MSMAKEEGFFTIAEDEIQNDNREEEIISIAEEEEWFQEDLGMEPIDPLEGGFYEGEEEQEAKDENWLSSGKSEHFIDFLTKEVNRFPKPSDVRGNVSKMEQALGQWKRLNTYVSKALREDYDNAVDVDFVDKVRTMIEQNIDQLEDMLEGIQSLKRNRKQMKRRHRRGEDESNDIVREATAPDFKGIQINISAFERAIVGALINGKVSGGKNIEELFAIAKKKYDIDDRQELAIFQILADFGYPEFKDRLRIGEEVDDPTRTGDEGEWQKQYYA